MKKLICILLSVVLILSVFTPICFAQIENEDLNYIIGNPYKDVDWNTWKAYKTQLHCHTNCSDGADSIADMVEAHYAQDYDILAISDHMTTGVQWDQAPKLVSIMRLIKKSRTGFLTPVPLTSERRLEILNGVGRDGRGMLEIIQANELNGAVPSNSHLNSYFSSYGHGLIGIDGDYETPAQKVGEDGGITFLNHIGNYTEGWEDVSIAASDKFVRKFSRLFIDIPSCVGMGINSAEDYQTCNDRVLYDEVLKKTIPYDVIPWSFTFSDAHGVNQIDRAFTIHMMKNLSVKEFRSSMENGTFFGIGRYARFELGEDFLGEGPVPTVSNIVVDQEADSITLTASNYDKITWVSGGKIVAYGETINLDETEDLSCYVRAYLTGPGGICYVQPFTINIEGVELVREEIKPVHDYSYVIRQIVNFLDKYVYSRYSPTRLIWNFLVSDWGHTIDPE